VSNPVSPTSVTFGWASLTNSQRTLMWSGCEERQELGENRSGDSRCGIWAQLGMPTFGRGYVTRGLVGQSFEVAELGGVLGSAYRPRWNDVILCSDDQQRRRGDPVLMAGGLLVNHLEGECRARPTRKSELILSLTRRSRAGLRALCRAALAVVVIVSCPVRRWARAAR